MTEQKHGQVITFYSYKGGTGRTMAVANVATILSDKNKVLVIDWDLEAPGMHYFFRKKAMNNVLEKPGLIDLFEKIQELLEQHPEWKSDENEKELFDNIKLDEYLYNVTENSLFLLAAGRFVEDYPRQVAVFQWEKLFYRAPWIFRTFAKYLTDRYDYVLIDSRTGLNDISGICTALMPEKLIAVFTPSLQSITGIINAIKNALHYRKESDDLRLLNVFPLPSRLELQEKVLLDAWRFGSFEDDIEGYQPLFEELLKNLYDLEKCDLKTYFDNILIQQVTYYAYGERIAVSDTQGAGRLSLIPSYSLLTETITNSIAPWTVQDSQSVVLSEVQELVTDADNAYYATEYDKAIELYKQALAFAPDNKHVQEQLQKVESYLSIKDVKPPDLMTEALRLYKRSRSFIAIGDLDGAKTLLQQAITVAEKAGMDFTNAKALLENIQNAIKAEEYKKKAYDELDNQQWIRAEANLSLAFDLDPTDPTLQILLSHLRSLLKAQNLMLQLNSGFGNARNRSKINKEVEEIFMHTNETPMLNGLWQELVSRHQKIVKTNDVRNNNPLKNFFGTKKDVSKIEARIPKIFISYSHKDEMHKDELVTILAGLQRRGIIDAWQDRRIEAGEEWFDAIRKAMKECNMAVLLVSPDFIASSFLQTEELKLLFQRRIEDGLRVVPIIVRPCLWDSEPIIKDLQALPKNAKPVISFSQDNGDRDQVWADISKAIEDIVKDL